MAATYRLSLWRRGVNALVGALLQWGLGPPHTYLLTVRGRKSGRLHPIPVTLVEERGQRWLVAPYGEVAWVHTARATRQIIPWVFHRKGKPIKSYSKALRAACQNAGLVGHIPHDFRPTAVRNLEPAGVPRSPAMKIVGHKTESVYRRYAIADEGMLREAATKLTALHQSEKKKRPASRSVIPLEN